MQSFEQTLHGGVTPRGRYLRGIGARHIPHCGEGQTVENLRRRKQFDVKMKELWLRVQIGNNIYHYIKH